MRARDPQPLLDLLYPAFMALSAFEAAVLAAAADLRLPWSSHTADLVCPLSLHFLHMAGQTVASLTDRLASYEVLHMWPAPRRTGRPRLANRA